MANRSDIDSSTMQDPIGSDDASSNPTNEMSDECSDASQEINNEVLVGKTVCSRSHSEEGLSDSISDKCVSPSSTSHGALEMKSKVMTRLVDKLNPSSKCQSISDTSASSHPLDVPDCHEVQALVHEAACFDPCSAENLDRKCRSFSTMNCDSLGLDVNPVLDSHVADNTLPSKLVCMNDTHEVLEAVPSGNLSEENITKENNRNEDGSDSVLNHSDKSFLQIRSDSSGEIG